MNSKRIDIGAGSALALFSLIVFLYANQYKGAGVFQYGPNFFPQVLAVGLFVTSILLIVQAVKGKSRPLKETIDKKGFIRSSITLGIAIAYLLLMQVFGFFLSTLAFLFVLMTFIGQKGLVKRIINCVAVNLAVYGIFYFFLKIPLPEGILIRAITGGF
ncbi:MAG: tripartite tricarboxylate transporter TctB family protein [Spirochaetales bacterium]|nr:tripartite tricarboxylate transporter TctB family protein [Spirochaetales bacterium]